MNIKELIKRTLAGEELSPEEQCTLENFDPDFSAGEELARLQNEYAELQERHQELRRSCRIEKIAAETGCTDPEYFDFLARKHNIDLEDSDAVKLFADEIAARSPGCFHARITPGPNHPIPEAIPHNHAGNISGCDRIGRIVNSLNSVSAENI